jgi:hypothetical protein
VTYVWIYLFSHDAFHYYLFIFEAITSTHLISFVSIVFTRIGHMLMTPSKCANLRVTRGLISNSQEIVEKVSSVLVKQPTKQVLFTMTPTPPCGCQAQGFGIRTVK